MARPRYKIGDVFYSVSAFPSDEFEDGTIEPAEVVLETYIVRTIRRSKWTQKGGPRTVYAYPQSAVRKTQKGLVFEDWGREFLVRWKEDEGPQNFHDLHRSKSAAYRSALAKLRKGQKEEGPFARVLEPEEFRLLEGRLKGGITRNSKKKRE